MLRFPVEYEYYYNCSFYDTNQVPIPERQHTFVGMLFVVSASILFALYAICLYAMLVSDLKKSVSYKLMIQLGLIHLIGIITSGIFNGVMAIEGAVFCTHSTLIYFMGCLAVGSWCASTLANMILGVNRCCELYSPVFAESLFGGYRILIWVAMTLAYMIYFFMWTPPPVFNGILMGLFFNPHLGYFDDVDHIYQSVPHSANNIIVCCTESLVYLVMIVLYRRAISSASQEVQNRLKKEKRIYIQVILIGFIHFTASSSYVMAQFIPINFYTMLVPVTFYFLSQAFPSVIYICINRTLRNTLFRRLITQKTNNSSVDGQRPLKNAIGASNQRTDGGNTISSGVSLPNATAETDW